jgi:hypothetical protein
METLSSLFLPHLTNPIFSSPLLQNNTMTYYMISQLISRDLLLQFFIMISFWILSFFFRFNLKKMYETGNFK